MKIVLSLHSDFGSDAEDLILGGELEGGFSIDYALSALVSYHKGKEVILYSFKPHFQLDNRNSRYHIQTTVNEIVIHFI